MAKASIGRDGLYLNGKLCCTIPPSGAENTGLSSDAWPLVVKVKVFGMVRYILLSNTGKCRIRHNLYNTKMIMSKSYEEWRGDDDKKR